jgi:hypothetical protein
MMLVVKKNSKQKFKYTGFFKCNLKMQNQTEFFFSISIFLDKIKVSNNYHQTFFIELNLLTTGVKTFVAKK